MSPRLAMPMPLSLTFHEGFAIYTTAKRYDLDEGVMNWFRELRDFLVSTVNGVLSKVTFIDDLRQMDDIGDLIGKLSDESAALEGAADKIGEPVYRNAFRAPEIAGSAIGRIVGTVLEKIAGYISWPVETISEWAKENSDVALAVTLFAVIGSINAAIGAGTLLGGFGIVTAIIPALSAAAQAVIWRLKGSKPRKRRNFARRGILGAALGGHSASVGGRPIESLFGDGMTLDEGMLGSIKQLFLGLFADKEALRKSAQAMGVSDPKATPQVLHANAKAELERIIAAGGEVDSEAFRWGLAAGRFFSNVVMWLPKSILNLVFKILPKGFAIRFFEERDLAGLLMVVLGVGQLSLLISTGGVGTPVAVTGFSYAIAALMGALTSAVNDIGDQLSD